MPTNIFVNLPTTDLERSKAFYTALGFTINPAFTDENAACVVLSDDIYFMVLTREYLGTFTDKQIIDPKTHAQTSIAFTRDSRDEVDAVLAHPGNRTAAASASHLSRSVFYQRLALIGDLLGVDLDDGETLTALHLALLVRRSVVR